MELSLALGSLKLKAYFSVAYQKRFAAPLHV